jgi:hypothetical protein
VEALLSLNDEAPDAVVAACAQALTLDARFLTTADAARDVAAVRTALGLEHPRCGLVRRRLRRLSSTTTDAEGTT